MSHDRVRASYDAVATRYDAAISDELVHKHLDRGVLDAFVAMCPPGLLADVGCGPGHVTAWLAARRPTVGVDLSPEMIRIARARHPGPGFEVGSMTALAAADGAWAGAVALYSVIHLDADARGVAFRELHRAIAPGGLLLVSFHVADASHAPGTHLHLDTWWEQPVDLDTHFLDPDAELLRLRDAGFALVARIEREPGEHEYPSRRASLLVRRP